MSLFDKIRVPLGDPEDFSLTTEELEAKMMREVEEARKDPNWAKEMEEDRMAGKELAAKLKAELEISDPEGVKRLEKLMRDRGIREKEPNRENREK